MENGTAEFGRGEVQIERRKKTLLSLFLEEQARGATDQQIDQRHRLAEQRKQAKKAQEERRRNRSTQPRGQSRDQGVG